MSARLTRLVLVVALLAGWQAALQHPIEHVDELGALVHVPGGESAHDVQCDLLAALTACAPEHHAARPPVPVQSESALYSEGAARRAQPPPFLSQGPPAAV